MTYFFKNLTNFTVTYMYYLMYQNRGSGLGNILTHNGEKKNTLVSYFYYIKILTYYDKELVFPSDEA